MNARNKRPPNDTNIITITGVWLSGDGDGGGGGLIGWCGGGGIIGWWGGGGGGWRGGIADGGGGGGWRGGFADGGGGGWKWLLGGKLGEAMILILIDISLFRWFYNCCEEDGEFGCLFVVLWVALLNNFVKIPTSSFKWRDSHAKFIRKQMGFNLFALENTSHHRFLTLFFIKLISLPKTFWDLMDASFNRYFTKILWLTTKRQGCINSCLVSVHPWQLG